MAQTNKGYRGTQWCKICHEVDYFGGIQYQNWSQTLHSKIHLFPDSTSIRPLAPFTNGDSVTMGPSYGNAMVYLSRTGSDFCAKVGANGTRYRIAWTYGFGYRQEYLVKIDTAFYVLPVQYNLRAYMDNSSGSWVSYSPGYWFNSDGSPKPIDNVFRSTSWDKNCMGCHVDAGRVTIVSNGTDTSWHATWVDSSSAVENVVGCENCHGPYQGGADVGHQMNPSKLSTKDEKIEVCAQCHARGSSLNGSGTVGSHQYPRNEINNTYFNPADTTQRLAEFFNLSIAANHPGGPTTWPDLQTAQQNRQEYQEYLGAKHYSTPFEEITCFTCHDPHPDSSNHNAHMLVDSISIRGIQVKVNDESNTLCLACHAGHGPFAAIPLSWVQNERAKRDSIGTVVNQHTKHFVYDPLNALNTGGLGRCTNCHMTKTAISAIPYDISTHTFAIIPPIMTIRYASVSSPTKGMLNTCAVSCHRNPSGPTSAVPSFGVATDQNLVDWTEATDVALAETLWSRWQAWGLTGVNQVAHDLPGFYKLSQNYPNPFNPSTKIEVELPQKVRVRLAVYNVIGEAVATLMDDEYGPGKFEVTWTGRDDYGLQVSSGIYFYKLEAGNFAQVKKMLLVK